MSIWASGDGVTPVNARHRACFEQGPMSRSRRCMLVLFAAILLSSCDQCATGESKCDGSRAMNCEHFSPSGGQASGNQWESRECGRADLCVQDPQAGAFCVLSSQRLPDCPAGVMQATCIGNDLVSCTSGYPVSS